MSSFEQSYYEHDDFWEPSQFTTGENAERIDLTARMVPADATSLADVGCGAGEFGRRVTQLRPEVSVCSIDRSLAALKRVQTEKLVGSVDAIPLGPRSRTVVSCLQVLEHIPLPKYEPALAELARVSARYLLISVPFQENLRTNDTKCPICGAVFNADLHLRSYSDAAFSRLFAAHGFELTRTQRTGRREQAIGLETYERLRRVVAPRPAPFRAPLCSICGYERPKGDGAHLRTANPSTPSSLGLVKGVILRNLPRRRCPDYWIIGLFERSSRV